jgi:hypothetical protein
VFHMIFRGPVDYTQHFSVTRICKAVLGTKSEEEPYLDDHNGYRFCNVSYSVSGVGKV